LKAHPPRQLWRQPVGPGWSSPIVVDNRVFTQEQRGGSEIIVSRDVATGNIVWVHSDTARFEESISGAGPRATPQFADGRIYSMGATGILNCLDAVNGNVIWSRNLVSDTGSKPFMWGFASSPLVSQGIVIVYVGGAKGLLGYRQETGEQAWSVNTGAQCYTSAQPAQIGGKEQVLFFSDAGLVSVEPASGRVLWNHDVVAPNAPRSVQPQVISDSQVLVSSETDLGTALVDVKQVNDVWHAERGWRTRALKPSFNDFVVHDGYAYGFDGQIFCCTDLKTGKRAWREGEYGHGQVLRLADQGVLLVTSEEGEIVLLRASPQGNQELSRFQALSGKTWNHPAIARGRLFVRNGQEMACFELTPGN
jgi:outer membrane protein assembly factor BamB